MGEKKKIQREEVISQKIREMRKGEKEVRYEGESERVTSGEIERHKVTEGGRGRDGGNDYEWKRLSLNQDMDSHK